MKKKVEGDIDILVLDGRIDQEMTDHLEKNLQDYLDTKKFKLVVDMTNVLHICSSALGVLVATKRKFQKYEGDIKLILVNENLKQLFEITMLNKVFEIYEDMKMALNSFDI
jgi:anti-anti-sigma factor